MNQEEPVGDKEAQAATAMRSDNAINSSATSTSAVAVAAQAELSSHSNATEPGTSAQTPSATQEVLSFLKTLSIFLCIAFFLRASVVEAFKIPSGSMIPTLRIGDHILVSKLSYGFRLPFVTKFVHQFAEPQRGDIVVFTRADEPDTNIIKRVVAVPGDLVEVRQTKLFINNQLQYEPYARYELNGIKNFGPERVPEGHVFMLGDNRDHSRDSRFWEDSPWLDIQRVKGRALIIYWSWDPSWQDRIGKLVR